MLQSEDCSNIHCNKCPLDSLTPSQFDGYYWAAQNLIIGLAVFFFEE